MIEIAASSESSQSIEGRDHSRYAFGREDISPCRAAFSLAYRREESAFAARAIYDRVAQRLGRENVFLDVDNIDLGADWFEVLSERVGACDALIAVIGRNWISSTDKDSRRRIDDPNDFVRIEIEAALKRGIRVIPVLIDGAPMPKAGDLSDSLEGLARRQNIEISHTRFEADADRLTRALTSIFEGLHPRGAEKTETPPSVEHHRVGTEWPQVSAEEARDYRLRADRGEADGQVLLGTLYSQGRGGVPKDEREAARL